MVEVHGFTHVLGPQHGVLVEVDDDILLDEFLETVLLVL
jgi:hypothetical protein